MGQGLCVQRKWWEQGGLGGDGVRGYGRLLQGVTFTEVELEEQDLDLPQKVLGLQVLAKLVSGQPCQEGMSGTCCPIQHTLL